MNSRYDEELAKLANKKATMENNPHNEDYKLEYKDQVSMANYFAAEAYLTQGAFFDIVGGQSHYDGVVHITTPDEFLDSFIENIGDFLKEYKHMRISDSNNIKECKRFIVQSSKYLYRASEALGKINNTKINNIKISKLDTVAKGIRDNVRNKKVEDNCGNMTEKECITTQVYNTQIQQLVNMVISGKGDKDCNFGEIEKFIFSQFIKVINFYYEDAGRERLINSTNTAVAGMFNEKPELTQKQQKLTGGSLPPIPTITDIY
jgi:hypothetical protein